MIKLLLFLANTALFAVGNPLNINDVSSERYVTLYDDEGNPEVFDLLAPRVETFASSSDITLHLYTRENPTSPVQLPLDANAVASAKNFVRTRKNIFIIHGWKSSYSTGSCLSLRTALVEAGDANVFVVDWSGVAGGIYTVASSSVSSLGRLLGAFIGELQQNLRLGASDFTLIGHSLGAHLAGSAGGAVNGNIGVIVALDPAGPGFLNVLASSRLDPSDAQFVQAIHTNTALLGYSANLGTVDIRPNGGSIQPGCKSVSCSHSRAYQYFAESVTSGGFTARACGSYKNFTRERCESNASTRLGGINIDVSARGEFFLTTNSKSPYSQG